MLYSKKKQEKNGWIGLFVWGRGLWERTLNIWNAKKEMYTSSQTMKTEDN